MRARCKYEYLILQKCGLEYITDFPKFCYLVKVNNKNPVLEDAGKKFKVKNNSDDAIVAYRKLKELNHELSDKEKAQLDKECKVIEQREVIEVDSIHKPQEFELTGKGKIKIGPPTLTRFEKARILGARALQLSLGAQPFIQNPKTAKTSLDIAMIELEQRIIPITIRRVFPNGDFQNIPIDFF